jgi:hypothetical protein
MICSMLNTGNLGLPMRREMPECIHLEVWADFSVYRQRASNFYHFSAYKNVGAWNQENQGAKEY